MLLTCFEPHPSLLEYVESIHIVEIKFTLLDALSPIYTFVPTHTRFLCFYLSDKVKVKKLDGGFVARARSIIIGPQLTPVTLDLGSEHFCVIVSLKPCGMYRLLGVPLQEIVDRDYDARLVIGSEIDEVLEQLQEAQTNALKNEVIQQYLLGKRQQLKPALAFDLAMVQLVRGMGNLSIDYLANQSNLSVRQFERKSLERLGLPPKVYARMVRFTHAYNYKERNPSASWSAIAYRCGYFDQMHLIRDFKFFAGFTPNILKEENLKTSVRFNSIADK
jgi:AraC-like DNA-binding protein